MLQLLEEYLLLSTVRVLWRLWSKVLDYSNSLEKLLQWYSLVLNF